MYLTPTEWGLVTRAIAGSEYQHPKLAVDAVYACNGSLALRVTLPDGEGCYDVPLELVDAEKLAGLFDVPHEPQSIITMMLGQLAMIGTPPPPLDLCEMCGGRGVLGAVTDNDELAELTEDATNIESCEDCGGCGHRGQLMAVDVAGVTVDRALLHSALRILAAPGLGGAGGGAVTLSQVRLKDVPMPALRVEWGRVTLIVGPLRLKTT